MRIPAAALVLALSALPAPAAEAVLPGLADVTGVAADDVLNIRARPGTRAAIIGSFPPDATGIEVVEARDGWLRVALPEGSGWISARHARLRPHLWQSDAVPPGLSCHGTEPFWGLALDGDTARFATPETASRHGGLRILAPEGHAASPHRALVAEGLVAIIAPAPALCSDGMSDRPFGLEVGVVVDGRHLRGCCSIGD